MAFLGFDATTVAPQAPRDALPEGKYTAVITSSEEKPTKAGTGSYLELVFEIVDGPHKGRKLWERLNLQNQNLTAVAIAKASLSAICYAVGILRPQDSTELHNKPLEITVKCKRNPQTDEIQNEIKGFAALGSGGATVQASQPTVPASGAKVPPWKRQ